jgi:hypothetical protein
MAATDPLYLEPPDDEDLKAAEQAWKAGRLRLQLHADSVWYRILRAHSPAEAMQYAQVCYPSDASNRFSPVRRGGVIVLTAYAGDRQRTVAWEVVLRDIRHKGVRRVPQYQTRDRYLVRTKLARSLSVINLRRPEIENLTVAEKHSPRLSSAPDYLYEQTRRWAQLLYDRIPDADGFIYESHQVSGNCVVLFQPEGVEIFKPSGRPRSLRAQPTRRLLRREAARVGAQVDFEEIAVMPDPA